MSTFFQEKSAALSHKEAKASDNNQSQQRHEAKQTFFGSEKPKAMPDWMDAISRAAPL